MSIMEARPFVSIVVPCLNEEASISECLESILSQDYPLERFELLIADGGSTDGTVAAIHRFAARHPRLRVRVIANPERIQAAGCNRAIAESRGDVIVRMDAHAKYRSDYVTTCVDTLASTGAQIVGGAQRPAWRTPFQHALAATLESPLAVGGAAYRDPLREGFVDTVWLGAFRRSAFEMVGLFDERAVTNEDAELNYRVSQAGGRVFLSRDIVAHYYPRDCLRALGRQYFRYGVGRARTTLKHKRLQSPRPLAPAALVLAFAALSIAAWLSARGETALILACSAYLVLLVLEATRIALRRSIAILPDVIAILPTIHFAWGFGFLFGLLRYGFRPDWKREPARLATRHVAEN